MATRQENARALLQLLATDDAFRARFEANPQEVLAEYGFVVDPSDQAVQNGVSLPSKDQIAANLDQLSLDVDATDGVVVFKV